MERSDVVLCCKMIQPRTAVRQAVLAITLVLPMMAFAASAASEATETLIDGLVSVDSPSEGLDAFAEVQEFFAINQLAQFQGGIYGSLRPQPTEEMRELVRRGVDVLPALLAHLDDARPTKLKAGGMCTFYGGGYDARVSLASGGASISKVQCASIGVYTIKIGDVCYVLIGQIINRRLWALRYVPTAIVVVRSPVYSKELRDQVIADWANLNRSEHIASLIIDAGHRLDSMHDPATALTRLRYYYPDEYRMIRVGELKEVVNRFEAKHPADSQEMPTTE